MATASASTRAPPSSGGSSNPTGAASSGPSVGAGGSASSSGPSKVAPAGAQQPQISLLGTLPLHLVPSLLRRIETTLVTLAPDVLCEKETVLARHDDEASAVRETGDNAWASVVKARRGVKLRVRETARSNGHTECTLCLPLPSLPERQYPRASVRPSYTVEVLSDTPGAPHPRKGDPLADGVLGFDPEVLDTDKENGWKSLVSALGWRAHFALLRYGLAYTLNASLFRHSSTATPNPLNPSQHTRYTLNVYRIFVPDPSGYTADWTPLDPQAATVVVELTATVGAQLDQSHFNHYCTLPDPAATPNATGGLDPNSTIESAMDFADHVAKHLRGLVDLRREAYD